MMMMQQLAGGGDDDGCVLVSTIASTVAALTVELTRGLITQLGLLARSLKAGRQTEGEPPTRRLLQPAPLLAQRTRLARRRQRLGLGLEPPEGPTRRLPRLALQELKTWLARPALLPELVAQRLLAPLLGDLINKLRCVPKRTS